MQPKKASWAGLKIPHLPLDNEEQRQARGGILEPPLPRTRTRREHDSTLERSVVGGKEEEMSGLEQELGLSLGVLIDVVDEQWMRDTLPVDGASPSLPR